MNEAAMEEMRTKKEREGKNKRKSSLWFKNLVSPKRESFQEMQITRYTNFNNLPVEAVYLFFHLWGFFHSIQWFFSL